MTLVTCDLNVYCPECHPGYTRAYSKKKKERKLPFGHGKDLVAFNGRFVVHVLIGLGRDN